MHSNHCASVVSIFCVHLGRLKMNQYGMFQPTADNDECVKEYPGDYCMKAG